MYLTSISLDQWMTTSIIVDMKTINIDDHSTTTYFGIWYVYIVGNKKAVQCQETDHFVQYHLQGNPEEVPTWVHMSRFMVVMGLLFVSFSILIALTTLLYNNNKKTPLVFNTIGCLFVVTALGYTLPTGMNKLPGKFEWSKSYILDWIGSIVALFVAIGYSFNYFWKRESVETCKFLKFEETVYV